MKAEGATGKMETTGNYLKLSAKIGMIGPTQHTTIPLQEISAISFQSAGFLRWGYLCIHARGSSFSLYFKKKQQKDVVDLLYSLAEGGVRVST